MGYDLHITRADNWISNEKSPITSREWMSLVEQDPELVKDPQNGEFAVRWQGAEATADAWFDWFEGNIFTTNPSSVVVSKMLRLADTLGARVQNDEGDFVTTPTDYNR